MSDTRSVRARTTSPSSASGGPPGKGSSRITKRIMRKKGGCYAKIGDSVARLLRTRVLDVNGHGKWRWSVDRRGAAGLGETRLHCTTIFYFRVTGFRSLHPRSRCNTIRPFSGTDFMSVRGSRMKWVLPLVAMGISLGLASSGYAQNPRSPTNRPAARKAPDQPTRSKSTGAATGNDELADDDSVKQKPATGSGMKKKKTAGSSKSARGKTPGRQRGRETTSGAATTITAGGGGGLSFSGEL